MHLRSLGGNVARTQWAALDKRGPFFVMRNVIALRNAATKVALLKQTKEVELSP
jgi:hypothetical protein